MRNKPFPNYPDDADYTTNAPSYYEDLARKEKLIRLLAERIWGYEKILDETLEEIQERFRAWDKNLEDFPEDVKVLLQQWLDDGTMDHIINDTIFSWKLDTSIFEQFRDTITAQLQQNTNKLKTVYSVFDFGAVGDGVTDDTQAFQTAFDEIPHYSILMVGNHRLGGGLVINGKIITIRGYSQANGFDTGESTNSKLWFKGAYTTAITMNANSGHSLTLENVTIKGEGTGTGVNVIGGSLVMDKATILSFDTGAIVKNGYYSKLVNSFILDCNATGIVFDGCYNVQTLALGIQSYGDGIRLKTQSYLLMHGGSIERFQKDGIVMEAGSSVLLNGTYFEGVSLNEVYKSAAVKLTQSCSVIANGCHVYLNNSSFFINAYNATNIKVKASLNRVVTVSVGETRQNTVYFLTGNSDSYINIEGDRLGNINGTEFGENVTYTNLSTVDYGVGKYYIDFPINIEDKILDNRQYRQGYAKTEPLEAVNSMIVTCNNQGSGTDDFLGIRTQYGYGQYTVIRNKNQWEKVGIRLPQQANSVAQDVETLKNDFNALLTKLRNNGVMIVE